MHTLATAAAAVGRNKTAILRAIKAGKIPISQAPLANRRVRSRRSNRSENPPSLPRRCSHRRLRPDPRQRKRNTPSYRRQHRTVHDALTTCAEPAARYARAIAF